MGRCAWAGLLAALLACSTPVSAWADGGLVLALAPTLAASDPGDGSTPQLGNTWPSAAFSASEPTPGQTSTGPSLAAPAEALGFPRPGGGASAAGGLRDVAPGMGRLPGLASFYSQRFHGRPTASGEPYLNQGWTAAHRDLPLGSWLSVTNPVNGVEVVVRVNDRGPFHPGRLVDLSVAAAQALGLLRAGVAMVVIRPLSESEAGQRVVGLQFTALQLQTPDAPSGPTSAEKQAQAPVPAPEQTPAKSLAQGPAAAPGRSAAVRSGRPVKSTRGANPSKRAQPVRR